MRQSRKYFLSLYSSAIVNKVEASREKIDSLYRSYLKPGFDILDSMNPDNIDIVKVNLGVKALIEANRGNEGLAKKLLIITSNIERDFIEAHIPSSYL